MDAGRTAAASGMGYGGNRSAWVSVILWFVAFGVAGGYLMPILKHVPPPHECGLPNAREHGCGTIYRCDECGTVYTMRRWGCTWERKRSFDLSDAAFLIAVAITFGAASGFLEVIFRRIF